MKKIILSLILSGVCSVAFSAEDSLKDLKDSDQTAIIIFRQCDPTVAKDSNPGTKYHDEVVNVEYFKLDYEGNIVSDYMKTFVIPARLTGSDRDVLLDQIMIEQKRAREARQKLEQKQKKDFMWQIKHNFTIDRMSGDEKYENFETIYEILPRKREVTPIKIEELKIEEHIELNSFNREKLKHDLEKIAEEMAKWNPITSE